MTPFDHLDSILGHVAYFVCMWVKTEIHMYTNKYRKAEMWQNAKSTALIISFDLNCDNNNKKRNIIHRPSCQARRRIESSH